MPDTPAETGEPVTHTGPAVGYYVHHHGSGHTHRALSINRASDLPITGLSTAPRPQDWRGPWLQLPDDAGAPVTADLTAGDRLHYAPIGHDGFRTRMAAIAAWIERTDPAAIITDVSVEVALLARLHGVPVVSMAMPGRRIDAAHRLGYDIADLILAPWPEVAGALWRGTADDLAKTRYLGAISRFAPVRASAVRTPDRRVVVLNGTGGTGPTPADIAAAAQATPGWQWVHLDRAHGTWVDDPWPLIRSAEVVVSHAGQNAIAEIAAARRPAVVVPQDRPFDEQRTLGRALSRLSSVPAIVRADWPSADDWPALLDRASRLDGTGWSVWNDGHGAARAAAALSDAVRGERVEVTA